MRFLGRRPEAGPAGCDPRQPFHDHRQRRCVVAEPALDEEEGQRPRNRRRSGLSRHDAHDAVVSYSLEARRSLRFLPTRRPDRWIDQIDVDRRAGVPDLKSLLQGPCDEVCLVHLGLKRLRGERSGRCSHDAVPTVRLDPLQSARPGFDLDFGGRSVLLGRGARCTTGLLKLLCLMWGLLLRRLSRRLLPGPRRPVGRLFRDDLENGRAHPNYVARTEQGGSVDFDVVNEDAVGRPEVADADAVVDRFDRSVPSRHLGVVDDDVGTLPPDNDRLRNRDQQSRLITRSDNQ